MSVESKLFAKKMQLLLDDQYCRGCGAIRGLTLSHLIKRSRRPDLILEDKNLEILCLRCHQNWEVKTRYCLMMFNFFSKLQIIKEMDNREYNEWQEKIDKWTNKNKQDETKLN